MRLVRLALLAAALLPAVAVAEPAAAESRGRILMVHGGAWSFTGPIAQQQLVPAAAAMRRIGWAPRIVSYRPGTDGLEDVRRAARRARRRARRPICLYGESAGGHLALVAASLERIPCVVMVAAPVDLLNPGTLLERAVSHVFGAAREPYDPATYRGRLPRHVFGVYATEDPVVTVHHAVALRGLMGPRRLALSVLDAGTRPWMHGAGVDPADETAARRRLQRWLRARA